jgi:hypothetical protein
MMSAQLVGMGGIVFIRDRNTPSRQRIAQSSIGILGELFMNLLFCDFLCRVWNYELCGP